MFGIGSRSGAHVVDPKMIGAFRYSKHWKQGIGELRQENSAVYLGLEITAEGTTNRLTHSQLDKAWGRLKELKVLGMNRTGLHALRSIKLLHTLLRPVYEYGIYFIPVDAKLFSKIAQIEEVELS